MELLERLLELVKARQPPYGCHGFEHTLRVVETCRLLGEALGANMEVLLPAAALHDIARGEEDHADAGGEVAREVLGGLGYPYVEEVVEVIKAHSYTGGRRPGTMESRILSDADKLDAMGAIGIYRAAMYSAEHGRPLSDFVAHFHEKLLRLPSQLYTPQARAMAVERYEFMLEYLRQLGLEVKGLASPPLE